MARKKSKQSASKLEPSLEEARPSISPSSSSLSSSVVGIANGGTPSTSALPASTTSRKSSAKSSAAPSSDIAPPLLISRNKHWKFISCFHGSWLQMPFEVLEAIAHINYNTVLPRPVEPSCLFDILRVRRLFEEATNLAVRAASDIASPMLTNVNAGFRDSEPMGSLLMGMSMGMGIGGPPAPVAHHGARLSKERRFRMREQACQKLARAYRLDEIACTVATMQGASPLEDIGKLVLQRSPSDPDARYVDFFHGKIPSRKVAQSTSLQPLTDILSDRPGEPEVLRTRALTKVFRRDYDGAIQDLTHALSTHRFMNPASHAAGAVQKDEPLHRGQLPPSGSRRRTNDVLLTEKEQPSSFVSQILFQRATACFALACEHVRDGMPMPAAPPPSQAQPKPLSNGPQPAEDPEKQAESRRLAKHFARRAIKDYMAFISQLHYSPDYPIKAIQEYTDRVTNLTHIARTSRDPSIPLASHAIYPLSELFAEPPDNLPPFPPPVLGPEHPTSPPCSPAHITTCEWLTFHPLIIEVLHSLLLCHVLVQTPPKELQRHAYMAARLVRLADGFPIFQASRSPARADWLEVLRRAGNWLHLADSWENLTSPLLIPFFCTEAEQQKIIASANASLPHPAPSAVPFQPRIACSPAMGTCCPAPPLPTGPPAAPLSPPKVSLPMKPVAAEPSSQAALKQHEPLTVQDPTFSQTYNIKKTTLNNIGPNCKQTTTATTTMTDLKPRTPTDRIASSTPSTNTYPAPTSRLTAKPPRSEPAPLTYEDTLSKWIAEDAKEHPILTDRAAFLIRWLQEAPAVAAPSAGPKRRKRAAKPSRGDDASSGTGPRPKHIEDGLVGEHARDTDRGKYSSESKGRKENKAIGSQNGPNLSVGALARDMSKLNVRH